MSSIGSIFAMLVLVVFLHKTISHWRKQERLLSTVFFVIGTLLSGAINWQFGNLGDLEAGYWGTTALTLGVAVVLIPIVVALRPRQSPAA